jgi:hypothetical protein
LRAVNYTFTNVIGLIVIHTYFKSVPYEPRDGPETHRFCVTAYASQMSQGDDADRQKIHCMKHGILFTVYNSCQSSDGFLLLSALTYLWTELKCLRRP